MIRNLWSVNRAILTKQEVQSGKAEQDVVSVRNWPEALLDDTAELRHKDWRLTDEEDRATTAATDTEGKYIFEGEPRRCEVGGIAVRYEFRGVDRLDH